MHGVKQGHGKFHWGEGSSYVGNFDSNEISGFGKYTWADGSLYSGDWYDNKINGVG